MKWIISFIFCIFVSKYVAGDAIWVARYNGPTNYTDGGTAITVDKSGYVYVTGYSWMAGDDFITIKYKPWGDTLWVKRYNGPGNRHDVGTAIIVDDTGNVYVTGSSNGGATWADYITIKYDLYGDTLWVRRYNGPGNQTDWACAIAMDDSGYIYVTGTSWGGAGIGNDIATIKYKPNGDTVWVRRYNGPESHNDGACGVVVDDSGYVYVAGAIFSIPGIHDFVTIKYKPNGDAAWVREYDGPRNDVDCATAMAIDSTGNIYVTGWVGWLYGEHKRSDIATIKYKPNGDIAWVRIYDGAPDTTEGPLGIAVDRAGNVYVTGASYDEETHYDYITIKYKPNGDTAWVRRYNGPGNGFDEAWAIGVDRLGNAYVTGTSYGGGETGWDYATIKYTPNGDTAWVKRYNGPGNETDWAQAIAVDDNYVYVTGWSMGNNTYSDVTTIKYLGAGVEEQLPKTEIPQLEIYPNPAFKEAVISYRATGNFRLNIYDLAGRLVRAIYSGTQGKGKYEVKLPPGIYFVRLKTKDFTKTKKLTILK